MFATSRSSRVMRPLSHFFFATLLPLGAMAAGFNGAAAAGTPISALATSAIQNARTAQFPVITASKPASAPGRLVDVAIARPVPNSPIAQLLTVKVVGNRFVNGAGTPINFQGVNVSGLEFVAMGGWSPSSPWGGQTGTATPNWAAIKAWGVNVVRIPLNESSWLGASCMDAGGFRGTAGAMINPDPGGNYKATVAAAVTTATAAGLYVILDLHWTAPGINCAAAQNPMADADKSLTFWTQVATTFKASPNVMFEAFNEPFLYWLTANESAWSTLQQGATVTQFVTGGQPWSKATNWQSTGMQQIVTAIRATGATNVILASGENYTSDLSQWLSYAPIDPLRQLAATWHAYPTYGAVFGTPAYAEPNYGAAAYSAASAIMAAGIPVLITEFGDHDAPGTASAPFASSLLPWADANHLGYLGWTWDVWGNPDFVLIKDATGTPSDGYGVYVKAHYLCRAAGKATCS